MVIQVVLRFAKIINTDLPLDFLDRLKNGISKTKVKVKRPYRIGFLFAKKVDEETLFSRFYDEGYEKDPLLSDDNFTETTVDNLKGQFKEVFFFKNKYFAYQTSKRAYFFDELIKLINSAWVSVKKEDEPNLEFNKITTFPPKLLKHFYEKVAKGVSYLKLKEIGVTEPNPAPLPKQINDMIEDVGKDTNSLDVKSKRDGNLQRPELLKQIVTISKVIKVRGLDIQGLPFTITSSGRISIYASTDEDERIDKLKRLCKRIFSFFLK